MTALAVPHVVEQIGAYAGFVAVIGLAVLSALYISQARDLRRLRDWAGRAPERAAEQAARGVVQPVPGKTVTAVPRPAQQPKPAATPATAAAAGAAAATAGAPAEGTAAAGTATAPAGTPPAATPAGAAAAADTAASDGDSEDGAADKPADAAGDGSPPEVAPVPVATAGTKEEAGEKEEEEQSEEPAASNGSPPEAPATPPPARPPRPATPLPRRTSTLPASRPSQTAIPPRPGSKRAGGRRGPDPRYIALAAVGVLVLGAGAAIGIPKLLEEDDGAPATQREQQGGSASTAAPAVAPDEITVSVLNGTTVPGLAAQVGDQVENEGFVLGNVTNAAEQQRADSIVMYAPGHTRDARLVARRLRLNRTVEPVDPDSQGLAGDATVVVVVGQDQTR